MAMPRRSHFFDLGPTTPTKIIRRSSKTSMIPLKFCGQFMSSGLPLNYSELLILIYGSKFPAQGNLYML